MTAPVPALDFVVPGDIDTATGGYRYDRHIVAGLRARGWRTTVHSLDPSFPSAGEAAVVQAAQLLESIPSGRIVVLDGLVLGAPGLDFATCARHLEFVALIHHPVALEAGLSADERERAGRAEAAALACARRVIVTSPWTARALTGGGVARERLRVVEPGTESAPLARGSDRETLELLCVATLTARKGHAVLFDALAPLADRDWRLNCVGSAAREPATAAALAAQLERLGLAGRVDLLGEVSSDALERQYQQADVFVLASEIEGYGMVIGEAIARGIPVVATAAGAVPDTLPRDAGVLVPVGDRGALTRALAQVMDDPRRRAALAAGARAARERLPTWEDAAAAFVDALDGLDGLDADALGGSSVWDEYRS